MKCEAQQKACQNMPRKPSKTQPGTSPNPLKSRPEAYLGRKMHPKVATDEPRDVQERPRSAQELPKKRPRGTKNWPRAPQSQPSNAQEAPKSVDAPFKMGPGESQAEFWARSLWEALFNRLQQRFCVLFLLRATRGMCLKPRKNLGFS